MVTKKLLRVALLSDVAVAPRRRMLAGVSRYMQEHEPWAIYLKPYGVEKSLGRWARGWSGDGIISGAWGPEAEDVQAVGIPIVDMTGYLQRLNVPLVHTNDESVGRLGAEHLLDRHFRHFGFIEYPAEWSADRRSGFERRVRATGFNCQIYKLDYPAIDGGPEAWEKQQQAMVDWIRSLPKPVGIMTSTDLLGQQLLESCQRAGLIVPEHVAVIGADNDLLICEICYPRLSSVVIDDFQRGYQAAAVLDRLMAGKAAPRGPVYIEPTGVVGRASTDILAIDDQEVAHALRYIRDRACDGIGVDDVADVMPISRSGLERRFRKALGRTINDELVRVRVNRALELLRGTDLELKAVALKSGFNSASYMGSVFRERLGRTPGSYREPSKGGGSGEDEAI